MYKLELHLHTKPNSSCAKVYPFTISRLYKKRGYNGIVCTNHFNARVFRSLKGDTEAQKMNSFFKSFYKLKKYCASKGIDVFFGIELALRNREYYDGNKSASEILVYGITPADIEKLGFDLIDLTYEELYALAEKRGYVLIQSHPFRKNTALIPPEFLHGVEVINGHPGHNSRNETAKAYAAENGLIGTAGSDFHFVGGEGQGILTDVLPTSEKDVAEILLNGDFQFIKD